MPISTEELIKKCFEDWSFSVEAERNVSFFIDWLYKNGFSIIKSDVIHTGK